MLAGTGGSETFTAGHVRELLRRGIKTQIVTVGLGTKDGRKDFPDIPFLDLKDAKGIADLTGLVVFVNKPFKVNTKQKAAVILHCVTPGEDERLEYTERVGDKIVIATSIYSGQQWALYLNVPYSRLNIVLPFADPVFGSIKRFSATKKTRMVFAGRLHPDKGIYTLMETLHQLKEFKNRQVVTIVTAGLHVESGATINHMLREYPYARLIPAQKSIANMAKVLTSNDILLMPSVYAEPFGMLSIEAQHTGCRVVASNIGGLPETNCGLLTLVEPRSPNALMKGIEQALALGPATKKERQTARGYFTLNSSVNSLLHALRI